jgi:hypothetical protein
MDNRKYRFLDDSILQKGLTMKNEKQIEEDGQELCDE